MGLKFVEKGDKVVSKKDYDKLVAEYEALVISLKGLSNTINHINETKDNNPFKEALYSVAAEEGDKTLKRAERINNLIKGL